jgi:DHA1 family multidrug resistance protein-like MFS transporter
VLLATEPILVLITLYSAFVYGVLYLSFEAYPISFVSDRGWEPDISSLAFLAVGAGVILGSGIIIVDIKVRLAKRISKSRAELEPEERLPIMILGSFLLPGGLFWFAWTSNLSTPWPAQVLAGVLIATGLFIIYISCLLYIVDCYLGIANSAVSANTSVRALFGAAFPLFAKTMYIRLGVAWATSTLAFIAIAMIPVPMLFLKYGAKLRAWSRNNRLRTEMGAGGTRASGYGLATC